MKKRTKFSTLIVVVALIFSIAFSSVSAFDGEAIGADTTGEFELFSAAETGNFDASTFVFGSGDVIPQIDQVPVILKDDSSNESTKEATFEKAPIVLDDTPIMGRTAQTFASNNTPGTAEFLPASMLNKKNTISVDGQQMWYYFAVTAANTKVTAHLYSVPNTSDYDIYLWRYDSSTGNLINIDYSELANLQASGEENIGIIVQPGTYYFTINPYQHIGAAAQTSYSIYLSTANRDAYELNDSPYEATPVVNSFDSAINSDSIADEDWFRIEITQNYACHVFTLTNVQINNYALDIYNSSLGYQLTLSKPLPQYISSTVLYPVQFPPGVYYLKLRPTSFDKSSSAGNFRFRVYASNTLVTNYKADDFVQQYTTIQSYTITGPAGNGTYTGKITYTQERASMLTGEHYYASMRNQTKVGTKQQVDDWYAVMYDACGYQRFGSNPPIKVVEDWPN